MLRLMVMRRAILAAVLLAMTGCSSSPTVIAVPGPSALQLARGRWFPVPAAPVRLCHPQSAWDGHNLVVIEPGWPHCAPAAAAYDPRTNRWTALAPPPRLWMPSRFIEPAPLAAWGGGRLMLVSPVTGVTVTWSPASDPVAAGGNAPVPGRGLGRLDRPPVPGHHRAEARHEQRRLADVRAVRGSVDAAA
jgi:hypothetical protein